MKTLLGHLAQFASLVSQGEVLCTQGLTYLLGEHPDARAAFADEIAARANVRLHEDLSWYAEQRQADGMRPDLEGRAGATPIVKIEAKLDAAFDPAQLRSYTADLQMRMQDSVHGAGILVFLVPQSRLAQAEAVVQLEFGVGGSSPWRFMTEHRVDVAIVVMTWDDVLTALARGESPRLRGELEQFEGMYRQLGSTYIAPLADVTDLLDWRNHQDDFVKLVDRVTRMLTTEHGILPIGTDRPDQHAGELEPRGYTRRYVCDRPEAPASCFSVGVRDPFAGSVTPIWMRFNKTTRGFSEIHARLQSSHLAPKLLTSSGHIWIPLDIPLGVNADQMADALVTQADEIRSVAFQASRAIKDRQASEATPPTEKYRADSDETQTGKNKFD